MRRPLTALVLTGTLAAAGAGQAIAQASSTPQRPGQPSTSTPRLVAPAFAERFPARFSGDLPCADCPGIRHVLELYADHGFVHRMTYLGRGEKAQGAHVDDVGRWSTSVNGRTLVLRGTKQRRLMFEVKDARTLRQLDSAGMPIESRLNYELVREDDPEPLEPQLTLRGVYLYMADAAIFIDCATGWRLPVAMEADNVALERGYQAARTKPAEQLLVSLEGRLAMRPKMEGEGLQRSLVPIRFDRFLPGQTCQSPAAGTAAAEGGMSLPGTGWRLASATIGVPPPEGAGHVTLKFTDRILSAGSGCNTGTGSYAIKDGTLATQAFATTKRACSGPAADWEPAFFRFLASGPSIKRTADDLVLASAGGEMQFRAMPMPSADAVRKFIYVAAERKECTGVAPMSCLQVRDTPEDPWRLYYGEIVGFTHQTGIEYRLRILEDTVPNPPADGPSTRWFLDLIVEQRIVKP